MAMDTSDIHRGCRFSISELDSAGWRWTLHPESQAGAKAVLIYGEVSGTREDAIKAAHAAIERQMK
jgi:hypothetical protein